MDRNGAQGRNVSEKLDFVVAFVPFGNERPGSDFDAADMVVPEQVRLATIEFGATGKPRKSLLGQHGDPVVDRLQVGFVGAIHEAGQNKKRSE